MKLSTCALAFPLLSSFALGQEATGDEAFVAFAEEVERTINEFDATFMDERMDLDAFLARAARDVEVEETFREGFAIGFKRSFEYAAGIVENISTFDGVYHFLRMRPGEEPRAIFRHAGDDGLTYDELLLSLDADGAVRIEDVYLHATGEWLSETVRRIYVSAAAEQDQGIVERLFGKESDFLEALQRVPELVEMAATDPAGALEILDGFSKETREKKFLQLIRLQVASLLEDDAYVEAMATYAELFPGASELTLLLYDFHWLRGDYERCEEILDEIERNVLGDAYVDILRALLRIDAGDSEAAEASARKAVERDPRLEYHALWPRLSIALIEEDHAATLALLIELSDWGIEFDDLTEFEDYAAFVASPQHEKWLEHVQGG